MKTETLVAFTLTMTTILTAYYGELKERFNRTDEYQERIVRLEKKVTEERFKHLLTSYEFEDFKQHVATLIPGAVKDAGPGEKSFPIRSLASVVQKYSGERQLIMRANEMFEEGKRLFRDGQYADSARAFESLVKNHPYSAHIPVALFLLSESYFQSQDYVDVVRIVNKMIDLYPENEMTGHAMIRLGLIYERQKRYAEAVDLYRTILLTFSSDQNLTQLANSALRSVQL